MKKRRLYKLLDIAWLVNDKTEYTMTFEYLPYIDGVGFQFFKDNKVGRGIEGDTYKTTTLYNSKWFAHKFEDRLKDFLKEVCEIIDDSEITKEIEQLVLEVLSDEE